MVIAALILSAIVAVTGVYGIIGVFRKKTDTKAYVIIDFIGNIAMIALVFTWFFGALIK